MTLQKNIDSLLFLDENDFGGLRNATNQYYSFLSQITQISDDSNILEDENEISVDDGIAISPKDAARCVLDFVRTTKFLRAINATILNAQKRFPNEKIEILYAGCGPFAALAIPACIKFKQSEIIFSLIDIHQCSLESAKKIFTKLALEHYVSEYIKTDATNYQTDNGRKFHIIISETMQKTLMKEPQVAITLNLSNHLKDGGFFIPQKITIDVFLTNIDKEFSVNEDLNINRERIYLGCIFELSAKTASSKKEILKPKTIKIPEGDFPKMNLLLSTNVVVSDGFLLKEYDSGVTCPTILHDFPTPQENQQIKFCYILGENPHFEYN